MALSPHFFNKREVTPTPLRQTGTAANVGSYGASTAPASAPAVAPVPERPAAAAPAAALTPGGSKLTVGPNIKLKGVEITDCDTLVVEGLVEATMDSRVIEICEHGAFKGSAEIDRAEIHGQFDGNLTVRQKLTIYATGKVSGKIRYGTVVIEEGGQLTGEIQFGALLTSKSTSQVQAASA
ncbi:polymer-forming cytoskeletal protein [Rhodoferax sp.]|uniref:bactofilin family protein n=1 Tax=Rhodoferax sp. TaxID=50421 RepID=UPI00374D1E0B